MLGIAAFTVLCAGCSASDETTGEPIVTGAAAFRQAALRSREPSARRAFEERAAMQRASECQLDEADTAAGSAIGTADTLPGSDGSRGGSPLSAESLTVAANEQESVLIQSGPEDATAANSCPGTPVSLSRGQLLTITSTTLGETDDYTTFCADTTSAADAPDVVYAVTLVESGVLTLTLNDHVGTNPFNGSISIRKVACSAENAGDECVNAATTGETRTLDLAAGTYYVIVDGANQTSGDFTLKLGLAAPVCGDGVVSDKSSTEQCDSNPNKPLICRPPGHAQQCKYVASGTTQDTCPGVLRTANIAAPETLSGALHNTCPLVDNYIGTCAGGNVGGRESVIHFVPDAAGTLTVTVGNDADGNPACAACGADCSETCGPCFIPVLYARKGACSGASAVEVGCAFDPDFVTTVATLNIPVQPGEDVWVFVDSDYAGPYTAGPYLLQVDLHL
jgi:hypothetical protein